MFSQTGTIVGPVGPQLMSFARTEIVVDQQDRGDSTPGDRVNQAGGDSLIGKLVGQTYEVLSLLGTGGMSKVYKARHVVLDRMVALKFILPQMEHDDRVWQRFRQEARAANKLDHPYIARVREFGFEEERPFIVMDYVEGLPLSEVVEKQWLTVDLALEVTSKICQALEHAHKRGVVHRDIKPSNILVQLDEQSGMSVKVVDFGIAKEIKPGSQTRLTETGDVFGTPGYMSPEQCLGSRVDTRSDIYSVGCVLYELLVGAPPFDAESKVVTIMQHINKPAPRLSGTDITESLSRVVQKTLEKNPDDRYQKASELHEDLESIRNGKTPANVAKSSLVKRLPSVKRTQLMSRAILVLGTLVAVSAFSGLMVGDQFAFSFLLFVLGWWIALTAWCDSHRFTAAEEIIARYEPVTMQARVQPGPSLRSLWTVQLSGQDGSEHRASILALPLFDRNLRDLIAAPAQVSVSVDPMLKIPVAFKTNAETYLLHEPGRVLPDPRWLGELDTPLRRFLASVIDGMTLSVIPFFLFLVLGGIHAFDVFPFMVANTIAPAISLLASGDAFFGSRVLDGLSIFAAGTYTWLYFALLESSGWRATPGKLAMGLRICSESGGRMSFVQASTRFAGKIVASFFVIALSYYLTGAIQYEPPSMAGGLVVLGMIYLVLILIVWALKKSILHDLFGAASSIDCFR